MKRSLAAAYPALATGLFGVAVLLTPTTPATAATVAQNHHVVVAAYPGCDFTASQWVITWTVHNPNPVAATIGNIRVTPSDTALTDLPGRAQPGETVQGIQRLPGTSTTASITFDVNYDDLSVTYDETALVNLDRCGPSADQTVLVSVATTCDAAAGEWAIVYNVTNPNPIGGTIGNMRVTPPGHPLVDLPTRLYPLGTVSGTQRIPADQYTASITFDVNWDDNTVTSNIYRPVYIFTTCRPAT
jgi:hypothetical protein